MVSAARRAASARSRGPGDQVERARYLASISPERVHYSMQEHEAILAAVHARDGMRIAEVLYTHCLRTRDAVVAAVIAPCTEDSPLQGA